MKTGLNPAFGRLCVQFLRFIGSIYLKLLAAKHLSLLEIFYIQNKEGHALEHRFHGGGTVVVDDLNNFVDMLVFNTDHQSA